MQVKCPYCRGPISLSPKAERWWNQELGMVRFRVRQRLGNPMTAKQGIAHLHWVKHFIRSNLALYDL